MFVVSGRVVGHKSEICDLQQAETSREKASEQAFSLLWEQFGAINRKTFKSPGGESPEAEMSLSSFSSPVLVWWRQPTCCYCAVRAAAPRGVPFPNPDVLTDVWQARRRFPISSQAV